MRVSPGWRGISTGTSRSLQSSTSSTLLLSLGMASPVPHRVSSAIALGTPYRGRSGRMSLSWILSSGGAGIDVSIEIPPLHEFTYRVQPHLQRPSQYQSEPECMGQVLVSQPAQPVALLLPVLGLHALLDMT